MILFATTIGTLLTVGIYTSQWGAMKYPVLSCVSVALIHLMYVRGYVVMAESVIEDFVKSFILSLLGCCILSPVPFVGLAFISASVFALLVSQGIKCFPKTEKGDSDFNEPNAE